MLTAVEEPGRNVDRWIGWPYPRWLLIALIVLMAVGGVAVSVAAVRYDESSVVEELTSWGLYGGLSIIIMTVSILLHRRRKGGR